MVYKWTDADGVIHLFRSVGAGRRKDLHRGRRDRPDQCGAPATVRPARRAPRKRRRARLYAEFSITSPTPEQTFFGDEVVAVQSEPPARLKPEQTITWHLNGKELDDQGPAGRRFRAAAPGPRHLCHRRDHHRSGDGRQSRLPTASPSTFASPPSCRRSTEAPNARLPTPTGRSVWPLNSTWTHCKSRAASCSTAW